MAKPPASEAKKVESDIPWVCCAVSLPLSNGANLEVGFAPVLVLDILLDVPSQFQTRVNVVSYQISISSLVTM